MKTTLLCPAARLRCFCIILTLLLSVFFGALAYLSGTLPDRIFITRDAPLTADGLLRLTDTAAPVSAANPTRATLRLGVFPVKSVSLVQVGRSQVVMLGSPFGIRIRVGGVLVVGFTPVDAESGQVEPGRSAGLRCGDLIISADGEKLTDSQRLCELTALGRPLTLQVKRGEKLLQIEITPQKSLSEGLYKAGIWVRDSTVGLGTLTFYDPTTGRYAGLGHGVTESDERLLPLDKGEITRATVTDVVKGRVGKPGELVGVIGSQAVGTLDENTAQGVYGQLFAAPDFGQVTEVAMRGEVKTGTAYILCTVGGSGEPEKFEIKIERISNGDDNRDMLIRVTDERLLALTGGIVQGMSGSPIIQDGKLAGAVTHVLVNNPAEGYAIFADTMLAQLRSGQTLQSPAA